MSKHTPGPWAAQGRENQVFVLLKSVDCERIGFWIGFVNGHREKEAAANARLIAAAPMMFEVLKRLLPIAEDAAESLGRFCSDEGWAQEDMDRMDNVDGMLPLMRAAIKAAEGEKT